MSEKVQGVKDKIKALWDNMSRMARILLLCGAGAALVIIAVIIIAIVGSNRKSNDYVLLNSDFTRTEQALASAVLYEQGIDYTVASNGSILVLNKDEDRARMQLAAAGLPGGVYDSSYSPGLTSTQSDKQYLQNEELQRRLQSIIETYDEVDLAMVTISQPERSAFALQTDVVPPSADVSIKTRAGRELTGDQVLAIVNLVKNSVPGIADEDISVSDGNGDLRSSLSAGMDSNNAKLRLTEEVNYALRNRAMSMLRKMFGDENVEVQVSTTLDTDNRVSKTIRYEPLDPDNPERNPLNKSDIDRELIAGDRDGIAEGVPGANDNVGTPEYLEETANGGDSLTSYYIHDSFDYLVGSVQEEFAKEGLVITDASAAVIINRTDLPDGQRDAIMTMVSNATGIAVESVSVHAYAFEVAEVETPTTPLPLPEGWGIFEYFLLGLGILLVVALLIGLFVFLIKRRSKKDEEEEELEELEYDENGVPLFDLIDQEEDFEPITMIETNEQKLRAQIKDLADSDPEIVASLLKNWLSSAS